MARFELVPVGVGVVLLLAPLLFAVTAPDPVAAAPDQGGGPPAQLPPLLDAVAGRPATVLMGDLNARPGSAELTRPSDRPEPSDRPDRRIDYIWLSGDLAAAGFVATTSPASDHRGVAVTVRPGSG
jgi:endonuclease/exonuclease/phosphatase family metal-dependent hydrolase